MLMAAAVAAAWRRWRASPALWSGGAGGGLVLLAVLEPDTGGGGGGGGDKLVEVLFAGGAGCPDYL